MKNEEIRAAAKKARVYLWEVAEALGVRDNELSRRLRNELPQEDKKKILEIIEDIRTGGR